MEHQVLLDVPAGDDTHLANRTQKPQEGTLPEFITAAAFRELAAAGNIPEVRLVPDGGGFLFVTKIGLIERALRPGAAVLDLDTRARFARELGLTRLAVELANSPPEGAGLSDDAANSRRYR